MKFPEIESEVAFILRHQRGNGDIPYFEGGVSDVWDIVECGMALDCRSRHQEAARAYRYIASLQNADGSWFYRYRDGVPQDEIRDTNMSAYLATGLFLHTHATKCPELLEDLWPCLVKAMDFILENQLPDGRVVHCKGSTATEIAANSAIWMSLGRAHGLSRMMRRARKDWEVAAKRLHQVILQHPDLYDRAEDFPGSHPYNSAMAWYYPVLARVYEDGSERLASRWEEFVVEGLGCRCWSGKDWVTAAETCELALALIRRSPEDNLRALALLTWIKRLHTPEGGFWTGWLMDEKKPWPEEKTTWTSAAFVLATHAFSLLVR